VNAEGTLLKYDSKEYPLLVFGEHNLQNLMGAMFVAEAMGINAHNFLQAMSDFTGAGKRLQKVVDVPPFKMFKDFAHSPSKLKATTAAVKNQFKSFKLVACMELHTFSSLKKEFLPQYLDTMKTADTALVYFNPKVVAHKKLESITKEMVYEGFGGNVVVVNDTQSVLDFIHKEVGQQSVLLMMSSGNFDGINFDELGAELSTNLS
jgi:UDP-N-acetylmuramate: L-alanyl-gamma-D-glutamyl-meso-diaminopimelate ligase